MKEILVNGIYTLEEHRALLDKISGVPGLPSVFVHGPKESSAGDAECDDPSVQTIYVERASIIDGTMELVLQTVFRPVGELKFPNHPSGEVAFSAKEVEGQSGGTSRLK